MAKIRHSVMAVVIFLFVLACAILSLFNTGFRRSFISSGTTMETLGLEVARVKGCFFCHGPSGEGKVPNPGGTTIPAWQGSSFMVSMENEDELREWILDGAPQRIRNTQSYKENLEKTAIHMPAYGKYLTPSELKHLLAYYHAVSGTIRPEDATAKRGFQVAREKGCFTCHGVGGRIDMKNPHSLTGTIPAWNGPDFADLVHNDQELRAWILDGRIDRLDNHFLAQWFTNKQALRMPSYRGKLTEEEITSLMAYIQWLRNPEAPGHQPNFSY